MYFLVHKTIFNYLRNVKILRIHYMTNYFSISFKFSYLHFEISKNNIESPVQAIHVFFIRLLESNILSRILVKYFSEKQFVKYKFFKYE